MHDLLPAIVAGIVSGSSYALLALGLVIIFRSTDTVNFALGDMATLSVYVALTAIGAGLPVFAGLAIAVAVASAGGVATERLLIRPLGGGPKVLFVSLVITIGLALLIHAGIGAIWGYRPLPMPPIVEGSVNLLGVQIGWSKLISTGIALVALLVVGWFFRFTPVGIAMRACAEDGFAARLIGISPARIAALAWALGCGLAAIAAFFLAMDSSVNSELMVSALFRAFAGVFLGGLTSMPGAALGGFAIGVLDNLAGRYLSPNYRDTIVFAIIVAVLFIRPSGILGAGRKERV